ncbi:hypothetical protein MPAR168_15470 [Methylorubrum populi]
MRSDKLSRVRIFRIDPALDAAMTSAATRRGVPVSALLRDAIRSAVVETARVGGSSPVEARA